MGDVSEMVRQTTESSTNELAPQQSSKLDHLDRRESEMRYYPPTTMRKAHTLYGIASGPQAHHQSTLTEKALAVHSDVSDWFAKVSNKPTGDTCIKTLVESRPFTSSLQLIIVLNAVYTSYTADITMSSPGAAPEWLTYAEYGFTAAYLIELLLRIAASKWYFFVNAQALGNIFDMALVCLSITDLIITHVGGSGSTNLSFLRILRLLKLARVLRAVRLLSLFQDLAVLIESLKRSMLALGWVFVTSTGMMFVFSLIFVTGSADHFAAQGSAAADDPDYAIVVQHFGSVRVGMLSLYKSVSGGDDWSLFYEMVGTAGDFYSVIFLFYTFFFYFAFVNIVIGLIVDKAVASASPQRAERILEEQRKSEESAAEFRHLCSLLDLDKSGAITRSEFVDSIKNDLMKDYLSSIGLPAKDVLFFFDSIAAGFVTDGVPIDAFVDACMNLKGEATKIDCQKLAIKLRALEITLDKIKTRLHKPPSPRQLII